MSDNDCASHRTKAEAHFQASRFNEGMGELNRAIWCYESLGERNRVAEVHEEMAIRCLNVGMKERAVLPFEFAVNSWFKHGQTLFEQGYTEEACASYKRALAASNKAMGIDPHSKGGFLTSRDDIEKAINDLNCT